MKRVAHERATTIVTTIASTGMEPLETLAATSVSGGDPHEEALHLFNEHGASIFRFSRSILRNPSDAEDVVQETYLKLLRHLRSGGDRSHLKSWLFTVAANACRDRGRWRLRWRPWRAELDDRSVDPVEPSDDSRLAHAAFRALAPRDRLLLSLRAHGLSYKEIAKAAEIREASVGRLLARAVARWKRAVRSP